MKPEWKGMISSVYVKNNQSHEYEEITEAEPLFNAIIDQNASNLSKAGVSPFAEGTLKDDCGPNGENTNTVDEILSGMYTTFIKKYSTDTNQIINTFIKSLRSPISLTDIINLDISAKDYQQLFNRTKEKTASSPSDIHIGHYKACAKCNYLSEIMAHFLLIPFQQGTPLPRWQA